MAKLSQSAMAQVRSGLKLIQEWRMETSAAGKSAQLDSTSALDLTRNELIQAFTRLDNDTVMLFDEEPVDINAHLTPHEKAFAETIPARFTNSEAARMHWDILLGKFLHWIASAYAWGSRSEDETKHRLDPLKPSEDYAPMPLPFYSSFAEQRQIHLARFRQWQAAFRPFLNWARTPEGKADLAAATALQLHWKAIYTALVADHFQGETCYDAHVDDFQEVVDLAERLIPCEGADDDQTKPKYTFDGSFILSVYAVALKCRDPIIRRRAIALLESRPRREGIMDSALSARISTIQMNIEEAGSVGTYIPEEARIRGIKTTYNMMARSGG